MPLAPAGLKVSSFSASQVILTWNTVAGGTYNLYRSQAVVGGFGAPVLVNASPLSPATFTDATSNGHNPPTAGATYLYWVTAIVSTVESAYSTSVSGTLIAPAVRVTAFREQDLDPIFNGPQGNDVTYVRYGYSPVADRALWDRPPGEFGTAIKGTNQKPEIRVRSYKVPYITRKDQFYISGIVFYVTNVQDDGWGVVTATLSMTAV